MPANTSLDSRGSPFKQEVIGKPLASTELTKEEPTEGHMGKRSKDVTIVIVSWNTREFLRNCLRSILEETREASFEIFVIDNNSFDGSGAMVRAEFPEVKLIENRKNRGFAAACNQGICAAPARYILLLNPDTIVLDDAISRCVQYADSQPDVGVVGCQVVEDDHRVFSFPTPFSLFTELTGLYKVFPRSRLFGRAKLDWWKCDSEQDVDVIAGMFMLVRREAIEQIGLMDEAFFVYFEETDWCYRLAQSGWRRVFIPFARIRHLDGGGKSTSQLSIKMFVQMQKSALIYYKKHQGLRAWAVVRSLYIASNAIRMVLWYIFFVITCDSRARSKCAAAKAALRYHIQGVEP